MVDALKVAERTTRFIPNREELAWAAGFFDGEGYTGFRYAAVRRDKDGRMRKYRRVQMQIPQCDPEVLERFQDAVGGIGNLGGPHGPYANKTTTRAHWKLSFTSFPQVQAVTAMLWPWLGSVKRDQAKTALATYLKAEPSYG